MSVCSQNVLCFAAMVDSALELKRTEALISISGDVVVGESENRQLSADPPATVDAIHAPVEHDPEEVSDGGASLGWMPLYIGGAQPGAPAWQPHMYDIARREQESGRSEDEIKGLIKDEFDRIKSEYERRLEQFYADRPPPSDFDRSLSERLAAAETRLGAFETSVKGLDDRALSEWDVAVVVFKLIAALAALVAIVGGVVAVVMWMAQRGVSVTTIVQ